MAQMKLCEFSRLVRRMTPEDEALMIPAQSEVSQDGDGGKVVIVGVIDIILAIWAVIQKIFGMKAPATTGVTNVQPEKPVDTRSDDELLDELGVHRADTGTASADGVHDSSRG